MEQATQKRSLKLTMFSILFYRSRLDFFILGRNESSEPFITGEQVEVRSVQ